jgi:ankyrin repeat protein
MNHELLARKWDRNIYHHNTNMASYERLLRKCPTLINSRCNSRTILYLRWSYENYKLWLEKGADPNVIDEFDNTAINWCISQRMKKKYIKLLIKYGGKINIIRKIHIVSLLMYPAGLKVVISGGIFKPSDKIMKILCGMSLLDYPDSLFVIYKYYEISNTIHDISILMEISGRGYLSRDYIEQYGFIYDILPLTIIHEFCGKRSDKVLVVVSYLYDIILFCS